MSAKKTTTRRGRRLKSGARLEPWSIARARILQDPDVRIRYDEILIREQVGEVVATARKAAGLTQAVVAARAGTTQSVIARLEHGRGGIPSLSMLSRIAEAIGLHLEVGFRANRAA